MTRRASADTVLRAVMRHCHAGVEARALRIAIIGELQQAFDVKRYVWVLTDPATCVGVDPLADVPGVTDLARTIRLKYATALNRWTTLTGVACLGDQASASPLWREVQQPLGVADVASAVFRDSHGCWGFLDLWLGARPAPDQMQLLASLLPDVTTALRTARADSLRLLPPGALHPSGPATLLLDANLSIQGSTRGWTTASDDCCRDPTGYRGCRLRP